MNYVWPNDPDPRKQDAAKVVIPPTLNSLRNYVDLPMPTEDGAVHLIIWDSWWGAEFGRANGSGLTNHKSYQFRARSASGSVGNWFEVRSRWDGGDPPCRIPVTMTTLAAIDFRNYGAWGPNVTSGVQPIRPQAACFNILAERWIRYWAQIDQRSGDYDLVTIWVADRDTGPVKVLDALQFEIGRGLAAFEIEFNTSTSTIAPGRGDLVAYVRNVVHLRNAVNVVMPRPE